MQAIVDDVMEFLRDACPSEEVTRAEYIEIIEMLQNELDLEAELS